MLETLLALTTAHFLADFTFQTPTMVRRKREPQWFVAHIVIVTVLALLLSGSLDPRVWLVIGVTHAAMDFIKVRLMGDGLRPFLIDQGVHLAVIVGVTLWRPDTVADGWIGTLATPVQLLVYQAMVIVAALAVTVKAGGILVAKTLEHIARPSPKASDVVAPAVDSAVGDKTEADARGLPGGGETIGALERALILLFLLIGQPEGIGLMLAAKSVLRFSDRNARAHTEYVIIGTMLSFGWALLTGVIARAALTHWG